MNFMLRFGKQLGCACLMLVAANQASAFSLGGPIGNGSDSYQVNAISYNLPGDNVAPKNLGEEYRLTTPVLYWATDSTFFDYFGSNGVVALERAFDMYNRLTNVSSYSYDLSEFPLESGRVNYTAQSLQLFDLKSATVNALIEHLGLADPDRFTWALRARIALPGTCLFEYHVIMRNFDPVTWVPSRYVNGTLYSYIIDESCPVIDQADATELMVDPFALPSTAVASEGFPVYTDTGFGLTLTSGGLWPGTFYTSFTRDDIGGLRYLYRASNINFEDAPTDTLQFQTNANPQLIYGSNLTLLASQALTNTAAQLQALYPGLVITSSSNYFVTAWVTNLTAYFTNHPWMPIDSFPQLVIQTNRTLTIQTLYDHRFQNLAVLNFGTNGWEANAVTDFSMITNRAVVTYQAIVVEPAPWLPIDSLQLVTNVYRRSFVTNRVVGEFFVLPTNACTFSILAVPLTNVVVNTNFITSTTNAPGVISTNAPGFTNLANISFEAMYLDYFTNHALVVLPVDCVTNVAQLRQGVERIRFVRRDYDSLLGRFFEPITNDYSMMAVINNNLVQQNFRRIITAPDIQVNAGEPGGGVRGDLGAWWRSISFRTNSIGSTAGPGTIEPFMNLTFNKVGPLFVHIGTGDESSGSLNFIWASFDASTNAPFIYPEGRTIQDLENQIIMQVSPTELALPEGTLNEDYTLAFPDGFLLAGGQGPYTWTAVSGMPPGLTLQPGANTNTATLSGTPTSPGTYDLIIRITDAPGRSITRQYTLRINR